MIRIRKAADRGHADHGWLDTRHTFSFADYYDPDHMGFRDLRVINDDRIEAGRGFPMHSHRDMEILTYVLEGELEHKDSMGTGSRIRPGEIQRMSAGTGVRHSEYNASADRPLHLLQIWIVPGSPGIAPSYEQKNLPREELAGRLRLIAAPDADERAVALHQDTKVYASLLSNGQGVAHELAAGRHAWVHVARGALTLNGHELRAGDGAAASDERILNLAGIDAAEVLVFDLR
ncbi:MAG: pirin family protein [Candidatus Wallbacteria bacterium]|nr:pirin family protein [Candidatus Wallbacteria bacterium]